MKRSCSRLARMDGPCDELRPFGSVRPVIGEPGDRSIIGFDGETLPAFDPAHEPRIVRGTQPKPRFLAWRDSQICVRQSTKIGFQFAFHSSFIIENFQLRKRKVSNGQGKFYMEKFKL